MSIYGFFSSPLTESLALVLSQKIDTLQKIIKDTKSYVQVLVADGCIGKDDPLLRSFQWQVERIEKSARPYLSEKLKSYAKANLDGNASALAASEKDSCTILRNWIHDVDADLSNINDLLSSIKITTEKCVRYSTIEKALPFGKGNFAAQAEYLANIEFSAHTGRIAKINTSLSTMPVQSRYMEHDLNTDGALILPEALKETVPYAFNALLAEMEFLEKFESTSPTLKEHDRRTLLTAVEMTRRLAILISKYYLKEVGKPVANIAGELFQGSFILGKCIISAYRGLRVLDRPHLIILRREQFATAEQFVSNVRLLACPHAQQQRHRVNIEHLLENALSLCSSHVENIELTMKDMMCENSPVQLPPASEESVIHELGIFKMLNEDTDDEEFISGAHTSTTLHESLGNDGDDAERMDELVKVDDITHEMEALGLPVIELPLELSDEIGRGSYASVREVPWKDSKMLAVIKHFKVVPDEQRTMKRLVREAQVTVQLRHDNVLPILGHAHIPHDDYTEAKFISYALVYPMYRGGSLQDFLSSCVVTEDRKVRILADIATAVAYLHDAQKSIGIVIHGDLRAANVLLTPTEDAVLCDFGLSSNENIEEKWRTRSFETNNAWLAYELFEIIPSGLRPKLTTKTDVFAFGCICYEVVHEQMPYQEFMTNPNQIVLRKSTRPPTPPTMNIPSSYRVGVQLRQIMEICWRINPPRRPSASKLESILRGLKEVFLS